MKPLKEQLKVFGLIRIAMGLVCVGEASLVCWATYAGFSAVLPTAEIALVAILGCIAAIIKATFHTVAGVGILRLRTWVGQWLLIGWPVVLIFTYGVFVPLLYKCGPATSIRFKPWGVFNWLELAVLAGLIICDLVYVRPRVTGITGS